jgi:hypothetical protein
MNKFEPFYNHYKKDDTIIIKIEGPGNCTLKSKKIISGEFTIIILEGIKKKR